MNLTKKESVTLSMIASIGATAFDVPESIAQEIRKRFEKKFGVNISDRDIANMINKLNAQISEKGNETVSID